MNASRYTRPDPPPLQRSRAVVMESMQHLESVSGHSSHGVANHAAAESAPWPNTLGRDASFPIPGLILLGPGNSLIACNSEALRILAYPSPTLNLRRVPSMIIEKTQASHDELGNSNPGHHLREIVSGRRRYICSDYLLEMQGPQALRTRAFLLDRVGNADVTMEELCHRFNLTRRERQAVGYLVKGMTSKEIAQEMGISPNTVKSFVRLVMTKAGVSTRAGLIGKVAGISMSPAPNRR